MKKRISISFFITSILLILIIFLTSCNDVNNIKNIHMKNDDVIEITAGDFNYEGKKLVLVYNNGMEKEIDLTDEMIPENQKIKFYKYGNQEIEIVYSKRLTTIMKIKVNRKDFEDAYKLEGYTCIYDGLPHKVELNNPLPDGATIDYLYGNSFTEAGEYNIVGVMSKEGYNPKTLEAKLIITKSDYDTNNIKFENLSTIYDGKPKEISVAGLPEGVKVTYEIHNEDGTEKLNNAIEAGIYKITAKFSDNNKNYNKLDNMEATLTINKASYDMSKIKFEDYKKEYDGKEYEPKITNEAELPDNVSVSYEVYDESGELTNSNVNAGEYKMVAKFSGDSNNYLEIPSMEAKLTVEKEVVVISDKVRLESKTVNYNREEQKLELDGVLPDYIIKKYSNNNKIYAGEYKVTCEFMIDDPNKKLDIESISAYLIINKIEESVKINDDKEIEPNDLYFEEENNQKVLKISGLDTTKYKITKVTFNELISDEIISINDLVLGNQYEYTININYVDTNENRSVTLSPVSGIITYII